MSKANQNQHVALIDDVCALLKRVQRWKWRNTSALARELIIDENQLLAALIQEAAKPDRRVCYHPLPSGRRMEILWGLPSSVADFAEMPSLRRTDVPDSEEGEEQVSGAPMVFLSHNHRDFEAVAALRAELAKEHLNSWLFETHIEFDEMIIPAVSNALRECQALLLFLSKAAIGSLWVQKEFNYLLKELQLPTLLVLDGKDADLIDVFGKHNHAAFEKYAQSAIATLQIADAAQWLRIANEFYHQLHDFLFNGGKLALWPADAATKQFGESEMAIGQWAEEIIASTF